MTREKKLRGVDTWGEERESKLKKEEVLPNEKARGKLDGEPDA